MNKQIAITAVIGTVLLLILPITVAEENQPDTYPALIVGRIKNLEVERDGDSIIYHFDAVFVFYNLGIYFRWHNPHMAVSNSNFNGIITPRTICGIKQIFIKY